MRTEALHNRMRLERCVLFLLAASLLISLSGAAGTAESCVNYNLNTCKGVFRSPVYIPQNETLAHIEQSLASEQSKSAYVSYSIAQCYKGLMVYHCGTNLIPCNESNGVIEKSPLCWSQCQAFKNMCGGLLKEIGYDFECNSPQLSTDSTCKNMTIYGITNLPKCPEPSLLTRLDDKSRCQARCDVEYYSDYYHQTLYDFDIAMSVISLVSSGFVFLTWALFRHKRTFPNIMIGYLAICSVGIACGFLMKMLPSSEISCTDAVTKATGELPLCFLQGVILHYFPLALACWWLCVGINIHQMVVFDNKNPKRLLKYYHCFAWGFPALLVSIASFGGSYAYKTDAFPICTLDTSEKLNGLFLAWVFVFGSIGLVLIAHVSYRIYKSFMSVASTVNAGSRNLRAQARSFIFVLYYYAIFFSLLIMTYFYREHKDEIDNDLEHFTRCLMGFVEDKEEGRACHYDEVIPYSMVVAVTGIINGQGLLLLLTFSTTEDTYVCWRYFFTTGKFDYDPRRSQNPAFAKPYKRNKLSARLAELFRPRPSSDLVELESMQTDDSNRRSSF